MKTDAEVRDDVEAELDWDPRFDARNIAVSVKDGVVTLGGKVTSYAEKSAANRSRWRLKATHPTSRQWTCIPSQIVAPAAADSASIAREHLIQ